MKITFTGKPIEIGNQYRSMYKELDQNKEYVLTISEVVVKRSLDQNALYWKLLTDFATWGDENVNVLHNEMLSNYSVGSPFFCLVPIDEDVSKLSNIHLKKTSKIEEDADGKLRQWYRVMYGSHELNTKQFNRLIKGLVNEIIGSGAVYSTINSDGVDIRILEGYDAG